ncbi:discoidin domain-containing protein [Myxococcus sp. AS-1-15]|uniref:PKD domain-containing protein n=1 Tax=Myxococcus sp. AS-1-15 TaxID=2874600 RepID=UPI001CBF84AD|nr:discoidin domain-containing protein [Myxococcus sp. AS-1-15]MBZ4396515.1 discoidin domain-containing protein [Myxococcus sp. AS-1-15]BDT38028.1 discoidin domain-containing protein [Myxococcus sp. MH1]
MNKSFILLGSCVGALALSGCDPTPQAPIEESTRSASLETLVNVTLNKPATASQYQTDPYVFLPQYAVDGNITSDDSRWCTGEYFTSQRYLDVDLQGTFDLHRMEVYTGYQGDRAIASFALQYHDGTSWQPIPGSTVTGNPATGVAVSRTFTQVVRGQKVRFLCNEPAGSNCRVKELWVFGAPATPGANQPPVANAGTDQSVVLPTSSLMLTGSATDADGTIALYSWTKVSGPAVTLAGANTATLSLSGLTAGTFVFRLTVADDDGATHSDDVTVTVTSAPVNQPPVANAGVDRTVVLPTSSLTLTGTASDSDGTIASYAWTQVSGPTATLTGAATSTLTVSNLSAGTLVLRLTVTDDDGATHSDDVTVTVANTPPNQPPVANAGADRTVVLPNAGITLTGSATDSDGSITSYAWTQVSGPTASLSGANTPSLSVSALAAGTLVFRLTVTDDDGATHSDDVTVTVSNPTTTLTNVAKNKPATALSTDGANVPTRVTDDNLSTFWKSGWTTKRGTHLDIDLQGSFLIHGVELHSSFYVDSPEALVNFDLLAWDGGCWKPIPGGSVRNNPKTTTVKTVTFTTPVVASKVRLLWLEYRDPATGLGPSNAHVRELRVMGHPTTPSTGPLTCTAGEQITVKDARYAYALFLPAGYNADRDARWPIVFSLPGTGGVMLTDDHQAVNTNAEGLAWNLRDATYRAGFGAIAVSMHYWTNGRVSGENAYFNVSSLMALLGELKRDLLVDADRVYFAGFSGGANVLYESTGLASYMDRVSAFVPLAVTNYPVSANTTNLCNLRTLPIWPFHGGSDTMGAASQSTALKTKLETQCGGTTSAMHAITTYPGVGHSNTVWQNAFADPALWTWLFQQRISTRQP